MKKQKSSAMAQRASQVVFVSLACVALAGCKNKASAGQNNDELEALRASLDSCNQSLTQAQKKLAEYGTAAEQDRLAPKDVVVKLEGTTFVLAAPGASGAPKEAQLDDATLASHSKVFFDKVGVSRKAMERCYEQELKNNADLARGGLKITLAVSFTAAGEMRKTSINPPLSAGFTSCVSQVTAKWMLPAAKAGSTFEAPISLQPQLFSIEY